MSHSSGWLLKQQEARAGKDPKKQELLVTVGGNMK